MALNVVHFKNNSGDLIGRVGSKQISVGMDGGAASGCVGICRSDVAHFDGLILIGLFDRLCL